MSYDKLKHNQEYVRTERLSALCISFLCLFFVGVLLWLGFFKLKPLALLIVPLILTLGFLSLHATMKNHRLLKQLHYLSTQKTILKTYDATLYRPKVRFMVENRFSPSGKYRPCYLYGIQIVSPDKRKYYYFFDELLHNDKSTIEKIEEKLYREFHCQCYENTSIIKTFEDDPYFLKIHLGAVHK